MQTTAQIGKAHTIKTTFSRTTEVTIDVNADAAILWALLTNAADYTRWNSTITSMEGSIELGKTIKLMSTLDTKRTFKLKIKKITAEQELIWGDGKGNRSFLLKQMQPGTIRFTMHEKIGGLLFPLYAKYIPPFDTAFEQFAKDLKKEAEAIQNNKKN